MLLLRGGSNSSRGDVFLRAWVRMSSLDLRGAFGRAVGLCPKLELPGTRAPGGNGVGPEDLEKTRSCCSLAALRSHKAFSMAWGEALSSCCAPVLFILPSSASPSLRELLDVRVHPLPEGGTGMMAPAGDAGVTDTKGVALP